MFVGFFKGLPIISLFFLAFNGIYAQEATAPKITIEKITIEESEGKFIITISTDDVTRKITTDSREDFISKYPHLYRKFRNQIDGKSPATYLLEKDKFLRVEAPVIELVRDGKLEDVEVRLGQKYGETESTDKESWHRFKKEKHEEFRNIIENLKKQIEALKREIEWLKEHK